MNPFQRSTQRKLTPSKGTSPESETRDRILKAALTLFARSGYDGTTTKQIAVAAGVAEGTLFRHFETKKSILVQVATDGWIEILTDLLTELSEMASYKAVAQVMKRRMLHLQDNADLMRVCFMEVQFHEDLRDRIQTDVIEKMTDVAEAFFQTAMDQGVYRKMDPRLVARVFLGMFAVSGFSQKTLTDPSASVLELKEMAEGISEIFLNGVLEKGA